MRVFENFPIHSSSEMQQDDSLCFSLFTLTFSKPTEQFFQFFLNSTSDTVVMRCLVERSTEIIGALESFESLSTQMAYGGLHPTELE